VHNLVGDASIKCSRIVDTRVESPLYLKEANKIKGLASKPRKAKSKK
jgi:hypothetical protein